MTGGAQQALRRTMEIYSNTTRFALACNLSSKIIEPIQSRCAVVRFARLTELEILDRLLRVVEAEKVSLGNLSSDSFIYVVETFLLNHLFFCVAQVGSWYFWVWWGRYHMFQKGWRQWCSQQMETWGKLLTICKPLTVVSSLSTRTMFSRLRLYSYQTVELSWFSSWVPSTYVSVIEHGKNANPWLCQKVITWYICDCFDFGGRYVTSHIHCWFWALSSIPSMKTLMMHMSALNSYMIWAMQHLTLSPHSLEWSRTMTCLSSWSWNTFAWVDFATAPFVSPVHKWTYAF